ncbi:MAG: hypothetical protein KDK70_15665 [Myxococcales bacterium]|nr:hypothetical protein [Myxococcales bacterium]
MDPLLPVLDVGTPVSGLIMSYIDPNEPSLRRLHSISLTYLTEKRRLIAEAHRLPPVSLVRYAYLPDFEWIIVADGTHRIQAALEGGIKQVPCQWVSEDRLQLEARELGYGSFDELVHKAKPFRKGYYE